MREYEAMFIAKADLPEADLSKIVTRWESIMTSNGGEVIKKDTWGTKRLAYPINKQNRGSYFVYDVATTQENARELERISRIDENILRTMVIKLKDNVNVEARKLELKKLEEEAILKAAEAAREKAETEALTARRGSNRDEE